MVILDASGLPLAVHTDSASPHEVTLVQAPLDETFTVGRLQRIIGDRAYDRDPRNRKRPSNAGWSPVTAISLPLEGGAIVFLAQQVQAHNCPMGSLSRTLYCLCSISFLNDFYEKTLPRFMK